ncbi:hypothetical protein LTR37_014535 [Vermiconidia calcicola]|uniref:Uncharacterized protein n=1 Tax=Vermiconidia calcicola TaxID=1690605 RepID=A0ACC3MTB2_9PEZI|nr:hypothetical protein LTR37_014535 [Vermiconidia calcicola]
MKIHNQQAVSPGYWFVAPYARLRQKDFKKWNGPHIYDGNGELVWSGAPMFKHYNMYDFRLAKVDGEDKMTVIFEDEATGMILDSNYEISQSVDMLGQVLPQWLLDQIDGSRGTNMHDFNLIHDGKRVLMLTKVWENATREESAAVGFDGECTAKWQGFKEVDVATSEVLFEWSAHGHIELEESTFEKKGGIQKMCNGNAGPGGWDILHLNSIDKFPDGDYLLSSRHTDAVYKISHLDGSIVWRLGGTKSDFHFPDGGLFSRQHHARVYSQNETHTLISVFDNAMGTGPHEHSTADQSRGLLLSLHTDVKPMKVETLANFDRPDGRYTSARGSVQFLENGNAFVCWAKGSFISEHTSDGKLIMEAEFMLDKANTYRGYKYPWIGHPAHSPDVHAAAIDMGSNMTSTLVHVSWNGATEVAAWKLYRTNAEGNSDELIASTSRQGFETSLSYPGFATFVILEAIDANGEVLGRSDLVKTIPPANRVGASEALEAEWLQQHSVAEATSAPGVLEALENPLVASILSVVSCGVTICAVIFLWLATRKGRLWNSCRPSKYERVGEENEDGDFEDETLVQEDSHEEKVLKKSVVWADDTDDNGA